MSRGEGVGLDTKPGDESPEPALGLFEGYGVEIEYMIVDRGTLDVRPVADRVMEAVAGDPVSEIELDGIAWSNELVLHVLEMKTNGPVATLDGLADRFHESVARATAALDALGCMLLPGGVHPWMDPDTETRLWPHEYTEVYHTFDRIFSCRGHGWANLQSTHVNLPFRGDREFAGLHSAIRVILPLLPALAASSPVLDGRPAGALDRRMVEYRSNSRRVPSVAGLVVPEPSTSREAYEREVLGRIYEDLAPLDPAGVLRHEWVNARGAIPRFDRGTIEIRVLDPQECPDADLAVVYATVHVVRELCARILDGDRTPDRIPTDRLAGVLDAVVREGPSARIEDRVFLEALGMPRPGRATFAGDVWEALLERSAAGALLSSDGDAAGPGAALRTILSRGPLARRLVDAVGSRPDHDTLVRIYGELAECLRENRVFRASD